MYVNAKKRMNKKDIEVFYIYLCESVRVEGVVKNTQRYVGSINEEQLAMKDYTFMDKNREKFTDKELSIVTDKLDKMTSQ